MSARYREMRQRNELPVAECPKCQQISGNCWSQCERACPMPMSPHFDPLVERAFEDSPAT